MSIPGLAPRGGFGGIVAVWVAAAVITIVIGFAAPSDWPKTIASPVLDGWPQYSAPAISTNPEDRRPPEETAAEAEQALFGRFLTAFGFSEDAFRPHFETIALKNDKSVFNT